MNARTTAIARQNEEIDASTQRAIAERESRPRNALESLSARLQVSPGALKDTLLKTVFSACKTHEEFIAMVIIANEHNLNPLLREIYAYPKRGGGIQAIIGYDGWIKIMNAHPQFDGVEFTHIEDEKGGLKAIEGVIYRKDRTRPIKKLVYLKEFKRNTEPWNNGPNHMLDVRCLCHTVRLAFGVSADVEGDDAIDIYGSDDDMNPAKSLPARKSLAEELDDEIPAFDKETGEIIEQDEAKSEPKADLAKDPVTGMTELDEDASRALDAGEQQEDDKPEEEESLSDTKLRAITEAIAGAKSRNALTAVSQEWYLASAAYDDDTQARMEATINARRSVLAKQEKKD